MSKEYREIVVCPNCGEEGHITRWESLNGNLDPEAKLKLLSGELFKFTCESCGGCTIVDYPILYHDMTNSAMVYYVSEESVDSVMHCDIRDSHVPHLPRGTFVSFLQHTAISPPSF